MISWESSKPNYPLQKNKTQIKTFHGNSPKSDAHSILDGTYGDDLESKF